MAERRSQKREELVDTARRLFRRHGFHATGIDRVLEAAGVARMTLYNHFQSKEELIVAALELEDHEFRDWFSAEVERGEATAAQRLLRVFDVLKRWLDGCRDSEAGFTGCLFSKAVAEYSALNDPIHKVAQAHKRKIHLYLSELAKKAGLPKSDEITDAMLILIDGATSQAQITGNAGAADDAKAVARLLLAAHGLTEALPI